MKIIVTLLIFLLLLAPVKFLSLYSQQHVKVPPSSASTDDRFEYYVQHFRCSYLDASQEMVDYKALLPEVRSQQDRDELNALHRSHLRYLKMLASHSRH
ncbi:hypothetical protein CCAX7_15120 [Capsulimonas corticalis]|uniref:Uncharacterized protein n=1 Tax=Capsulimonas corticalis TaxID=2219043 RepID=A0A402CZC2_9BACT|nr:hypothetical protein [Capsulimonas corticalis]BDI29461.1 hypothetical protein CCAX7_15120 [Capsulimonas corticalis]